MSTSTIACDAATDDLLGPAEAQHTKPNGFFARLIEARVRSAELRAKAIFARMSDEHLAVLGLTPKQIAEVRRTGRVSADFWH